MNEKYDPRTKGTVTAIKIFLDGATPRATLAFAFGGYVTIAWNNVEEREQYMAGINAYTLIYDERPKRQFEDWLKPEELVFETYVPAVTIWPNSQNHEDMGDIDGYVRAYNVEVKNTKGELNWLAAEWIRGDRDGVLNNEFHRYYYNELGVVPTGRVSFRGYGKEYHEGRETYIHTVSDEQIRSMILTIEALRMVSDEDGYIEEQTAMNLAKALADYGFVISIKEKENK